MSTPEKSGANVSGDSHVVADSAHGNKHEGQSAANVSHDSHGPLTFAYADPPYPGQARRHYGKHPDYAGEVDHRDLIERLSDFDGWALSTSAAALRQVLPLCPETVRVAVWHRLDSPCPHVGRGWWWKWEPVIVASLRAPTEATPDVLPLAQLKTSRITGEKPYEFCSWLFRLAGLDPRDEFTDLYAGSGAVGEAWQRWKTQPSFSSSRARALRPFEKALRLRSSQTSLDDVDVA